MLSTIIVFLSLFALTISNKLIPNCNNCKWIIPNINNDYSKCKMFIEKKPSNEKIDPFPFYNYAKHCRENESLCGVEGYLFEDKEIDILRLMEDRLEELKIIDPSLYEYAKFLKK